MPPFRFRIHHPILFFLPRSFPLCGGKTCAGRGGGNGARVAAFPAGAGAGAIRPARRASSRAQAEALSGAPKIHFLVLATSAQVARQREMWGPFPSRWATSRACKGRALPATCQRAPLSTHACPLRPLPPRGAPKGRLLSPPIPT